MLLFIYLAFFYFHDAETACTPMEQQHTAAIAPSLTINILEFPDEHVLSVGYNVTIICTSNASKQDYGLRYNAQPYWIHFYFSGNPGTKINECGGKRDDNEDSKVCTYVIYNTSKSDSGNYTCRTHNQMHCTTGSFELDFKEISPPMFTINPPAEMFISRGGKVNMTCEASGVPNAMITWYKDGIPIPKANTTEGKGLSTLTLEFVTTLHEGHYWCVARNLGGWKRSSRARLIVKQMPAISRHPKNVSLSFKENITLVAFACKATGSPPAVVTWLKNNSTKANGTVVELDGISWLVFLLLRNEKRTEKYSCIARNSEGEAYSNEAMVISVPGTSLSFYLHPKSVTASPGDHVVFTCAVEGSLFPSIIWLKDGLRVVGGKDEVSQGIESSFSELHIASVKEQDVGTYACQATNAIEIVRSTDAFLSVTGKRHSKGDTSASKCSDSLLWILVATVAVLIVVVLILLFVIHKKYRSAEFKVGKETMKEQRYPNLYINEGAISQRLSNGKSCEVPH